MRRRLRLLGAVGVSALIMTLLLVGLAFADPVTIDTFNNGNHYVCYGGFGCGSEDYYDSLDVATGVLGGERDLYITATEGVGALVIDDPSYTEDMLNLTTGTSGFFTGTVTWDGNDSDARSLDTNGLGGADLTDGGRNDGLQLLIYFTDDDFDFVMYVYSGTKVASRTLELRESVDKPGRSLFVPFSDFSGDTTVFTSSGAIVLDIIPQVLAVDLDLDLFEATANTDWGDLPDTYSTTLDSDGANHIISGTLYLGSSIDYEADAITSTVATGDDTDHLADEEGVEEADADDDGSGWENGVGGGAITVTVGGSGGCLSGWLDWGEDGGFDEAGDRIITNTAVITGDNLITFTVPDGTFGAAGTLGFYARFRLYPDTGTPGCSDESIDYYGEVNGGEVEDYYWEYDKPTAVVISDLAVQPSSFGIAALAVVALLGLGAVGLLLPRRRKA